VVWANQFWFCQVMLPEAWVTGIAVTMWGAWAWLLSDVTSAWVSVEPLPKPWETPPAALVDEG